MSIDDEALRTMQAIGVVDEVVSRVVLGYGSDYFSARGSCFLRVRPTAKEYGYPRRNAFRQPVFEQQLRDYFRAHAMRHTSLRSVVQHGINRFSPKPGRSASCLAAR